jgi:hypothetical protein
MWWGQMLLLAQSSRPRLRRVMAWSHIQLLYHATKDSRVGIASLYSSKGYPSLRVPTGCVQLLRDFLCSQKISTQTGFSLQLLRPIENVSCFLH